MKTSTMTLLLMTLVSGLSACSRQQPTAAAMEITGTINYRTPVKLESDAILELRLTDVSISDGPALEVAKTTIKNLNALPYQYSLPYDAAKIDPQHRYMVDARILTGSTLRFSTDTAYEVLNGGKQQRDITVIAAGTNEAALTSTPSSTELSSNAGATIFQNELRTQQEVSLYKAGMQDGHILWLEEDRSNGTPQPLHARYEFKGALVLRYEDTSPMEVHFDERGRAIGVSKNQRALKLSEQADVVNAVRKRAELLRSHALATSEARAHRQATGG